MKKRHSILYILAFIITLSIFSAAFFVSSYFNTKKTQELKSIEDKIALDILSVETEYAIIEESSCKEFDRANIRDDLDSLGAKLIYMEGQVGTDNPELFTLKRYHSLLQIRDYLLSKRMSEECKKGGIFILYFYSSPETCERCQTQEYMLRAIRNKYPMINIYTFDYNLDLPAIQTLITLHNIPKNPPIIDINGKAYAAFDSLADMELLLEPLLQSMASSTATTTSSTPN